MLSPDRMPEIVFGQVPKKEAQFRRRQEKKKHPELKNLPSPYDFLKVLPIIDMAIIDESRERSRHWKENKKNRVAFEESVWGTSEIKNYVSPSTVCNCIRWVGEEAVADLIGRSKAESTVDGMVILNLGSAAHWSFEKILKYRLPGLQEMSLTDEEVNISGRADSLMRNPKTGKYQLIEFKTIAKQSFLEIGRDGLPEALKTTSDIYVPKPENRKQVLLYLWILDKQLRAQGKEIESASIIYVNRDRGQRKEALILWDSVAKYDAEHFVRQIIEAQKKIEATLAYIRENPDYDPLVVENMLPEPTVESEFACENYCPHRLHCLPGRDAAARGVKKESKKRPQKVYRMAKEERLVREEKLSKLGIQQPKLM